MIKTAVATKETTETPCQKISLLAHPVTRASQYSVPANDKKSITTSTTHSPSCYQGSWLWKRPCALENARSNAWCDTLGHNNFPNLLAAHCTKQRQMHKMNSSKHTPIILALRWTSKESKSQALPRICWPILIVDLGCRWIGFILGSIVCKSILAPMHRSSIGMRPLTHLTAAITIDSCTHGSF